MLVISAFSDADQAKYSFEQSCVIWRAMKQATISMSRAHKATINTATN